MNGDGNDAKRDSNAKEFLEPGLKREEVFMADAFRICDFLSKVGVIFGSIRNVLFDFWLFKPSVPHGGWCADDDEFINFRWAFLEPTKEF